MRITQHIDIAAPAERVWELVGPGFADIGSWASGVRRSDAAADGHGRVCTVAGVPGVDQVSETITSSDTDTLSLSYVADDLPFGITARNTWRVTPLDATTCRASFAAEVGVAGPARLAAPVVRWRLARLGRRTLAELRHVAEHGEPVRRKQRQLTNARRGAATGSTAADDARLLRTSLGANTAFSATTGLVLIAGGTLLDGLLGVPVVVLTAIGAGLVGFAAVLRWLLADPRRMVRGAGGVIAADVAWVATAGAIVVGPSDLMSPAGAAIMAIVSVDVALLAAAQAVGLRRVRRTTHGRVSAVDASRP